MGLFDALRGRRGPTSAETEDAADSDVPEPVQFRPRGDGSYQADGEHPETLRFFGARVTVSTGPDGAGPALTGEFTPGGRFMATRQFERPVFFAVLEVTPEGFHARRTSTADGGSREVDYRFVPNTPAS